MNIEQLINRDAEKYSPYMNGFVNHLPMGQLALYKLTGNIEKVEEYTNYYQRKFDIDEVKEDYKKISSIEECLGRRDLYESCLVLIREKLEREDLEELVSFVLNRYTLGVSSGLFHTTIRLAYAIEGHKLNNQSQEEVERALAYYITAYRKGGLFERGISKDDIVEETTKLLGNSKIKKIRNSNITRGQKLKSFYGDEEFMSQGFIIEGSKEDKIKGILQILIPAFYNSNNIVMLHTITGLHAVVVLEDYFKDYERALDILTTTALTHILTQSDLNISTTDTNIDTTWDELVKLVWQARDVHTIKIAYTGKVLDDIFKVEDFKYAIYRRIINGK